MRMVGCGCGDLHTQKSVEREEGRAVVCAPETCQLQERGVTFRLLS